MDQLLPALAFSDPIGPGCSCSLPGREARGPSPTPTPPQPPNRAASGGARRADFLPHADEVWWRPEPDGGLTLVVKAGFDQEVVDKAGAPQALWTEIRWVAGVWARTRACR